MFERLTPAQRINMHALVNMRGVEVAFLGVDEQLRPVVMVRDSRRTVSYALAVDGHGVDPHGTVRRLTDKEVEALAEWDSVAIFGLEWTLH